MVAVKMSESVATSYGAYNAGHIYELAEPLAQEFLRHGWAVRVEQQAPTEAAMLPRAEREPQTTRHGRGRPIHSR